VTLSIQAMKEVMLTRALAHGLVDAPPVFGLSRVYEILATAAVATLVNPLAVTIATDYVGFPSGGTGIAGPVVGLVGTSSITFVASALAASGFTGSRASDFFDGVSGIIEYFAGNVTFSEVPVVVAEGVGEIRPGNIVMNTSLMELTAHQLAVIEQIMVAQDRMEDPATHVELQAGELLSQARILISAVTEALAAELTRASRTGIPVTGGVVSVVPVAIIGNFGVFS
jgi:hypothetical protein